MFETMEEARAAIRTLTDEQLRALLEELLAGWFSGQISDDQAEFVSALIYESTLERVVALIEKESGATVN
jgi:hypothetical protein